MLLLQPPPASASVPVGLSDYRLVSLGYYFDLEDRGISVTWVN